MKKELFKKHKFLFLLFVLLLISTFSFWKTSLLSKQNKDIIFQIKEIKEQIKPKEQLNWNGETANQIAERINKYGANIILIGGAGSRQIQKEVYNPENQEYLVPEDEWVSISLNRSADLLRVFCRDGFKLINCNGGNEEKLGDETSCTRTVNKDIQNVLNVECEKIKK
ncbi:MAG: hypothetical protein WC682_05415 [Parcubacteria group bacterium]|jgi:hypothetical protein